MGFASRSGRAVTNPNAPRAFAMCDRCNNWFNHDKLRYQMEWRGTQLVRTNMLVCPGDYDDPNPQLRARRLPPDPVPIRDPRPDPNVTPIPE